MAGVRIQHVYVRSARFNLIEGDRPYPDAYQCTPPEFGGCGQVHTHKTHHLNLDDTGSVIIGDELYLRLKNLFIANGFSEQNVVANPPAMGVGLGPSANGTGQWGDIPIIEGEVKR
jgi:hypothetical protein